ncbi:MAG: sigma-70 family RNA polymerase sigma factor [Pseudanabaenaceae cyanobacterium]
MQLPPLPEISHPKIQALFQKNDRDLLLLFQRHPDEGQYFAAIFCRYAQVLYTLVATATRSPIQADYLFVRTWEYIFHEMRALDLRATVPQLSLQSWLINVTAMTINRADLPSVEEINYSLADTSPVLWCYLNQALNQLPGNLRLVLLLSRTFHWSAARIAAYLQAEGDRTDATAVNELLIEAYHALEDALPPDIREIYLSDRPMGIPTPA